MALTVGRAGLAGAAVLDGINPAARVDTPVGEVVAERLREGDIVLVAGGGIGMIKWIGRIPVPAAVSIGAGAISGGAPRRSLVVAPDQAVLVDGAGAIPARLLVNGLTLRHADTVASETFVQIALHTGACLLVEGLALPSADAPADVGVEPGDRRPALVRAGPVLDAAIAGLAERAGVAEIPADPVERAARLAAVLTAIEDLGQG